MILITGGAGYIGSHINKQLHKEGYDTVVLDNLMFGHESSVKWGEFIEGDLKDSDITNSIFNNYDIEAVMHFAAFTSVAESVEYPQKYYKNNFKNTLNLLNSMKQAKVNKFIFSSTAAVYGNPQKIPISENHPFNPINPYGKSKLMVEEVLARLANNSDFSYCSLRYFNASGADPECEIGENHNPETHLIPLILDVAIEKRDKIAIFGDNYKTRDGTCIRDYIHVCDLASAHIKAFEYLQNIGENTNTGGYNENCESKHIESYGKNYKNSQTTSNSEKNNNSEKNKFSTKSNIFNLGNGNGFSVKEVIDTCEQITKCDIKREIVDPRDGDPAILIADSKKAIDVLNWKPQYDNLEKIVETAWMWHKKLNSQSS
ncbi:MAG: UDP-glucose 4-epimerase GalE [Methanobacteriaceae archaeon]|jgi:UDP-glucose 4-epimerase|nr:UDP-glucose 4-epimerase GalE [Candidatus Methanorudis spinitermitis]